MGKKKTQKVEESLDPATQKFVEDFLRPLGRQGARTALGGGPFFAGPTEAFQQGLAQLQGLQGGLTPEGIQQFFNPFQEEVVRATQADFDRQREQALNRAAQEATGAGAFGGSRSGILQAQALDDVNRSEASTLAGLRTQGFNQAANLGLSNLGFQQGLGQNLLQAGEMQRQIQNQQLQEPLFRQRQALQFAQQGLGPFGQTRTATSGGGLGSILGSLGGLGLLGAGLFTGGAAPAAAAAASGGSSGGGFGK